MQNPTVAALAGAVSGLFLGYMMGKQKGDAPQAHDELNYSSDVYYGGRERGDSPLGDTETNIQQLRDELASYKEREKGYDLSFQSLQRQYQQELAFLKAEKQVYLNQISALEEEKQRYDLSNKAADSAGAALQTRLSEMQNEHRRIIEEKDKEIASIRAQCDKMISMYNECERKVDELERDKKFAEERHTDLRSRFADLDTRLKSSLSTRSELNSRIEELVDDLSSRDITIERLERRLGIKKDKSKENK